MEGMEILLARIEALAAENERLKMEKAQADASREEYKARYREVEVSRDEYRSWYLQAVKEAGLIVKRTQVKLEEIKQQTAEQTTRMAMEVAERYSHDPRNRIMMIKDLIACGIRLREAQQEIDKIVPYDKS